MMKKMLGFQFKKNRKYILIACLFLVWMSFFDNRNVFVQKNLNHQIEQLEQEYELYQEKLLTVKGEFDAMQRFPEKYAREKYYMHKSSEEVFIYSN